MVKKANSSPCVICQTAANLIDMVKGIYILMISVRDDIRVNVGALGKVDFRKGLYAYVGSSQNNLEKRVKRHLRRNKRRFWHVDYLLSHASVAVTRVFYKEAGKSEECHVSNELMKEGLPVAHFGCSDCACVSHLFMLEDYGFLTKLMAEMRL